MQYNAKVRQEIKRTARARVTAHIGRCIGIHVLYAVPFLLFAVILYLAAFGEVFQMLQFGGYNANMLLYTASRSANTGLVTSLLMLLFTGPLQFGLMRFYIGLHRGEEAEVSQLWQPFTARQTLWTGVRMAFCQYFRRLLWSLPASFVLFCGNVALLVTMLFARRVLWDSVAAVAVLCVVYLLVQFFVEIKLLTYQAGWVLLHEDEQRGAWDATRDATGAFRGHYGSVLGFVLSFFGWYVLTVLLGALCMGLAFAGLLFVSGGLGIAVCLLSMVAWLCISVLLGSFFSAYFHVSFFGLFEHFAARTGGEDAAQQTWEQPIE